MDEKLKESIKVDEETRKMTFQLFLITIVGSTTLFIQDEAKRIYAYAGFILAGILFITLVLLTFWNKRNIRRL